MGDGQGLLSPESQPRVCTSTRTWSRRGLAAPANAKAADQDGDGDDAAVVADVASALTEMPKPGARIGNAGWFFRNFNEEGASKRLKHKRREDIKSNPVQIIGLAECDEALQNFLQSSVAKTSLSRGEEEEAQTQPQSRRSGGYEYMCVRGRELFSVMLAVRANSGSCVQVVQFERLTHGRYRGHTAHSRAIIGEVVTDDKIGMLGTHHKVLVMHLHRQLARNVWPNELEKFWDWLAKQLIRVDVLMGDFGLALLMLVPALRSRGVTIDLAAWFPWKMWNGTPCADTCGIFFLHRPGQYKLNKGLEDLHAKNPNGILWDHRNIATVTSPSLPGPPDLPPPSFAFFDEKGPGFPLSSFLPCNSSAVAEQLRVTLTPSLNPDELSQKQRAGILFKVQEKRLVPSDDEDLGFPGHQSRHYPLCAFTKNTRLATSIKDCQAQSSTPRQKESSTTSAVVDR